MRDSQSALDSIFLSYNKILLKLKQENKTTKNGKEITHKDLRMAINIMLKKHPICRWRSEKINSKKYFILIEGYYWLKYVYFQQEKSQVDADINFFETRIKEYEKILSVKESKKLFNNILEKELEKFFNRKYRTIHRYLKILEDKNNTSFKYENNGQIYISNIGIELLCKKYFKQKYLEILEEYKMELTEQYIKAGYIYDNFFNLN